MPIYAGRHYPEYNTYLYGMRRASLIEEYDADQGKDPFAHIRN